MAITALFANVADVEPELEGMTVKTNESEAVLVPSLTFTVIVAVPACAAAGVILIVRLVPLPPNTMLPGGTRIVFEEAAERVKFAGGVSRSLTRNAIEGAAVS